MYMKKTVHSFTKTPSSKTMKIRLEVLTDKLANATKIDIKDNFYQDIANLEYLFALMLSVEDFKDGLLKLPNENREIFFQENSETIFKMAEFNKLVYEKINLIDEHVTKKYPKNAKSQFAEPRRL